MIERPPTQEREAATLYLTDLNATHNGNNKSDLLRFYSRVQTSRSKTRSGYTLMDPGASHCYIDSKYARNLGLPVRPAGRMSVITAGTKHPPETRYQIWLNGRLCSATGNYCRGRIPAATGAADATPSGVSRVRVTRTVLWECDIGLHRTVTVDSHRRRTDTGI